MSTLEANHTVLGVMPSVVPTGVAEEPALAGPIQEERQDERRRWQAVVDERLIEWLKDPSQVEDDDIVPPSPETIQLACWVAMRLRDGGVPPPLRTVPTGDGGIAFERRAGSVFETIEILADGSVEFAQFVDARLRSRARIL